MDRRFKKINQLLSNYSLGKFDKRLEVSSRLDEIDAIIAGINMLGEELKETTISKNYFNNIFNSVSDMVFVLDNSGKINDINKSVQEQLGYTIINVKGKSINFLILPQQKQLVPPITKHLSKAEGSITKNAVFQSITGIQMPVLVAVSNLMNKKGKKRGILLTAKDVTLQTQTANLLIRTIIDTQEKERQRLARDLHDSLGQQLSAIKFYISTSAGISTNEDQKAMLLKSNYALTEVLSDMRNICFNLMPKTLEEFGLIWAVKELCTQIQHDEKVNFKIQQIDSFPKLIKEIEIDLYRIIQEFITNAIKHGSASLIHIKFSYTKSKAKITLIDNGSGFDINELAAKGMGLQNIQSRVKSHNGEITITSGINKGTKYVLTIPVNT